MKGLRGLSVLGLSFLVAIGASASAAADPSLTGTSQLAAQVEVRNVTVSDRQVTGTIDNRSSVEIRDVDLQITRAWLWSDERNPGEINPGGTYYFRVPATIPAGGSVAFKYELPAVDAPPSLGSFHTTVKPVGVTEITYR